MANYDTKKVQKPAIQKNPASQTRATSDRRDSFRGVMLAAILFSILFGSAAGILFGAWVTTDQDVAVWVQKNVFGQTVASSESNVLGVTNTGPSKTIVVEESSATIDAVQKVSPSVVSIVVTQDLSQLYNLTGPNIFPFDLFGFDLESQLEDAEGKQEVGAGTGFIITSDGLILTNKHVVSTEGAEYTVIMNDGEQHTATVLDADPFNDIALIKIEAEGLTPVELGDSDTLEVGQTVIAIGNTLGEYQNTVTRGIVSGLSRTVRAGDGNGNSETLEDIIQTDAAINHGNSGGPLINLDGQVIGVNTAINREGQLIGFAIPMNQATRAIESVQKHGRIIRPYLGVRYLILNEEIAKRNNLDVDYGALIVRGSDPTELAVIPGSPADIAGLEENDIILEVNGQKIDSDHSLARQLQKYDPDDTVTLKVSHDGKEKIIEATLAEVED